MQGPSNNQVYKATILGEPASKANSRRVVMLKGKVRVIKSKKAIEYSRAFNLQARALDPLIEGDVVVGMKIFYRTRRPDLDESLVLDLLEDVAYKNDRQVKAKAISWGLDKENPRTEIIVAPLTDIGEVLKNIFDA